MNPFRGHHIRRPAVTGCRAGRGGAGPLGPGPWLPAAQGPQRSPRVKAGPQGRRRRRCAAAWRPEGRPRLLQQLASGNERRRQPPPSCPGPGFPLAPRSGLAGQELIQRLREESSSPTSCVAGHSSRRRRSPGTRRCARAGRSPWGSTGGATRWCSRWCRAARDEGVAEVDAEVGREGDLGVGGHLRPRPRSATRSRNRQLADGGEHRRRDRRRVWPWGRCTSITKRVALHQSADRRLPAPMIRSPSQCPGTARSSTSAGRSLMFTIPGIRPRRSSLRCGAHRPTRAQPRATSRSRPLPCTKIAL